MLLFCCMMMAQANPDIYQSGTELDAELTVMSYNIRYDNPQDGINAWPNRKGNVADMMSSVHDADVIGVQEALKHQLDDLQERMPGYEWVGVGRDDGNKKGEFSPIFYKRNRFDLLATNTFWLSEQPQMPGSKSWDAAITRIATWAKLMDRQTDREFYVINTHFDHRGDVARTESARLIVDFVESLEDEVPIFLTGDLNVMETSEAYAVLSESDAIDDARYRSESEHEGPTASFSDWETLTPDDSRIDYIFVNDHVRVRSHTIADKRYDGRFPSDHLPVIVIAEL